jgi:hypothetical protein
MSSCRIANSDEREKVSICCIGSRKPMSAAG